MPLKFVKKQKMSDDMESFEDVHVPVEEEKTKPKTKVSAAEVIQDGTINEKMAALIDIIGNDLERSALLKQEQAEIAARKKKAEEGILEIVEEMELSPEETEELLTDLYALKIGKLGTSRFVDTEDLKDMHNHVGDDFYNLVKPSLTDMDKYLDGATKDKFISSKFTKRTLTVKPRNT